MEKSENMETPCVTAPETCLLFLFCCFFLFIWRNKPEEEKRQRPPFSIIYCIKFCLQFFFSFSSTIHLLINVIGKKYKMEKGSGNKDVS